LISIPKNIRIEDHLGLAAKVALFHVRPGQPLEDSEAYADALAGLAKAFDCIEKYDPAWEFSTWATTIIKNYVTDGLRRRQRQARISTVRLNGYDFATEEEPNLPVHLLELFLADHQEDTRANKRSKRILGQHYLQGLTWAEIGRQRKVTRERAFELINYRPF